MTAIQMIKRSRKSSKLEQLSQKQEDEPPSWDKTDNKFILILTMWAKVKQSEIQIIKET
jgi:hypothetical protein